MRVLKGLFPHIASPAYAQRQTVNSRTPVSADTENINTFTAKVDHGRFQSLRFNLPASTIVDLKFI
jgi:hypothetical protein